MRLVAVRPSCRVGVTPDRDPGLPLCQPPTAMADMGRRFRPTLEALSGSPPPLYAVLMLWAGLEYRLVMCGTRTHLICTGDRTR
jgi:hypothetical protein